MLFKNITYIDENLEVKENSFVGVIDDKISYIGEQEPDNLQDFGEIYDGKNKLLMPGFINSHSHSAATLLRSYADKQPVLEWLNDWMFPFEAKMTGDDYYWASLLGYAEMMRFGITSCSDMYFYGHSRLKAIVDSKIKCNMSECIINILYF